MQEFTLTNDFHNTEATIRPVAITSGRFAGLHMVSRATMLRIKRKLCGMTGCCCGGQFGERGGAYLRVVNEDGDENLKIQSKNNTTLEIRNLNKTYPNKKVAVRGVDLVMYSDQIFALLGHNGAGKTTTISMISGLIPITTGEIKVMGFDSIT